MVSVNEIVRSLQCCMVHDRRKQGGAGGRGPTYSPEVGGRAPLKICCCQLATDVWNIRSFFVPAPPQDTETEVGKLKKITLQLTQRIRKCQIASQSSQTQRLCVANDCKACFSLSIVSNCDTNQFNDVTCNGNETLVHVCNYGCTIPVSFAGQ